MKTREYLKRIDKLNRLATLSFAAGRLVERGKRNSKGFERIATERKAVYNEVLDMLSGVGEASKDTVGIGKK